ncbi:DnaB-like helicase N-terminal domain-containing protein [Streptomyces sp. NPDC004111]|uniref:DnaB-like helicase N-terminal domain-containing protein n=1 Tax=Streptomyces sp. NPDC004111 TaxID=3364690 RepID=UPI0036BB6D30
MPPNPAPATDESVDSPPPPVFHVEQALLGALLLEPHRLREAAGISPDAFSTATHGALFAAIRTVPAPEMAVHTTSTIWLDTVLATARTQAAALSAPYLHTLIQAGHWPRHTAAYARIVEAEHARRRLAAAAHHLLHTATDPSLPHPVTTTLAAADALAAVADDLAARFPPHTGPQPRRTPAPTAPPAHASDEALGEERLLVACATAHPARMEEMRWLLPADFAHPLHGGLWQSLGTLARRGTPIDPVTVLWQAQQTGLLTEGTDPRPLLDLLSHPSGSPEHWGERIVQRSLLTTARHTAHSIQDLAHDPATAPHQLAVHTRRALAALTSVRTRWQHATTTPPPRTPRPQPHHAPATRTADTPRAGPPRTTARTTR